MTANQAILYVRAKRPNSIQTRGQLRCVREFVQFLGPLRSVFSCAEPRSSPVTLSQYLNRQRHMLHGYERREMRHLPKIVHLVSRLLLDIAENRQVIEEDILEAPDVQDIEMTLSVIEKLGPELHSKRPRLPGPPTLPRHFNEPPIFYHRKSLSYSDSDLSRLGSELNLLTQPLSSLSQNNVHVVSSPSKDSVPADQSQSWNSNRSFTSQGSTSSIWELKNDSNEKDGSHLLKKVKSTDQHSESEGNDGSPKRGSKLSWWKAEQMKKLAMNGKQPHGRNDDASEMSEVPFITLQSELSSEAKRLLVAQALAVDLFQDGEESHKAKVLTWQVTDWSTLPTKWHTSYKCRLFSLSCVRVNLWRINCFSHICTEMVTMCAWMCTGRSEPRWCLGKAMYGAGSLRPDWADVGMAGAAQRTRHLHPGC